MSGAVQGLGQELESLDKLIFRKVPVTWYGLATEVRIVGDFDNWSEGYSLSPAQIQDQTFTKFSAEIPLRPVRFLDTLQHEARVARVHLSCIWRFLC